MFDITTLTTFYKTGVTQSDTQSIQLHRILSDYANISDNTFSNSLDSYVYTYEPLLRYIDENAVQLVVQDIGHEMTSVLATTQYTTIEQIMNSLPYTTGIFDIFERFVYTRGNDMFNGKDVIAWFTLQMLIQKACNRLLVTLARYRQLFSLLPTPVIDEWGDLLLTEDMVVDVSYVLRALMIDLGVSYQPGTHKEILQHIVYLTTNPYVVYGLDVLTLSKVVWFINKHKANYPPYYLNLYEGKVWDKKASFGPEITDKVFSDFYVYINGVQLIDTNSVDANLINTVLGYIFMAFRPFIVRLTYNDVCKHLDLNTDPNILRGI